MSKEMALYITEELPLSMKFYTLMDLLISNQVESRIEIFVFLGIFYLQILSVFFSDHIGVLDSKNSYSDKILNYIERIVRIKDIFTNNYKGAKILLIILFVLILLILVHFLISVLNIKRSSFYSFNETLINYYIKAFIFLAYNIVLDLCFSNFCFGSAEYNPNFPESKCSVGSNIGMFFISILFIILCLVINIFIQIIYCDSFYLSNSYYAKINCNYDFYWSLVNLFNSLLLVQSKFLTREIFLVYNLLMGITMFYYYTEKYLYYDKITNTFAGLFHAVYAWSGLFFLIFYFINFNFKEKGIIYILTCIVVCFCYINYSGKIEDTIYLDKPFNQIKNKNYLLKYLKNLITKINTIEEFPQDRAYLSGVIKMHKIECPHPFCIMKNTNPIYLPMALKWSDRSKDHIDDDVFLKVFIIVVMNYFISTHEYNADMMMNLSLYYLKIVGNYCQSIYYYKKVSEMQLTMQEKFTFIRLKIQLSKALIEKLKPATEENVTLEHLDVSSYYKYDALSQKFVDEINKDVTLSLDFWKTFRTSLKNPERLLDFNKVFELTDKIRITKANVDSMWNQLLKIYSGANEYFDFFIEYTEQINDDDLKKRELEAFKRKNDGFGDHINSNFYSVLFNRNTGIIIANGDKGSEGIIEACNGEVENIFKYKPADIKGMNLSHLMPKIFAKDHSKYMENYFQTGEKKLIDKNDFNSFAKDKHNSIIKIKLALKLFPVLNDNVLFVGLVNKENIDDIILMDSKFNIQGMSLKLMKILQIDNKTLFQTNEIPFYVICRKFVNFFNIFLQGNKKSEVFGEGKLNYNDEMAKKEEEEKNQKDNNGKNDNNRNDLNENIEINENVELEYEIKLPQFLIDYAEKTNKNTGKVGLKLVTMVTETEAGIEDDDDDFDELALLMGESKNKDSDFNDIGESDIKKLLENKPIDEKVELTPTPGETPTPDGDNIITPNEDLVKKGNTKITNKMVNFNKQSDEEKKYRLRLIQYKNLFESGKFNELEDLIDVCNKESNLPEYKFNFTFDQYKFGDKQIAYIVRCIDNKGEFGNSDDDTAGEFDAKAGKYKKEKADAIKPYYEILENERQDVLNLPTHFYELSVKNKLFKKLLEECKNDIKTMSMVHGAKKDEIMPDENSSQSSAIGFDSGLVKKNRIEEIRSNLLLNVSNYYTLKYIKLCFILFAVFALIWCIIYITQFNGIYDTLLDVSDVNINLYQTTLWTTEIVSIFLSLRILFLKTHFKNHSLYNFNFVGFDNQTDIEYYVNMESIVKELYYKISDAYGMLDMDMSKYLSEQDLLEKYWGKINVFNFGFDKNLQLGDTESFPMSIAQMLSNSLFFVENKYYNSLNSTEFDELPELTKNITLLYFNYSTFSIIENSYDNLLQNQFDKLREIPDLLTKHNDNKKKPIYLIILLYIGLIFILLIMYFFFISLTNKSMTVGLEKVTKIKIEKIEETLKKIQTFGKYLKRFRDKDAKPKDDNEKEDSQSSGDENEHNASIKKQSTVATKKDKIKKGNALSDNGFAADKRKYVSLNILNHSVIHAIFIVFIHIGFIIPIYIFSFEMINNTNTLILIQNYIFGNLIGSSASTVEVKCFMSECQNKTLLHFNDTHIQNKVQDVIKGIALFDQVKNFYNEKYLLNACASAIDPNTQPDTYAKCMDNTLIKSANNTDNLIKIVENTVQKIYKQYLTSDNKGINSHTELFETRFFTQVEEIFYNYIIPVGDYFSSLVKTDLANYLGNKKNMIIILVIVLVVVMILYSLVFGIIFTNQLVHYLSISRCIMKIIPTSVIIATQDLETWIENKY